ncbi:MAG: hypothetical protein H7Z73_12315 [Candidatus Saccharibacteria bacterium]|nr:hypothetical protein [Moraxellaceae bacterium]
MPVIPQPIKKSVCVPTHITVEEAEDLAMACFMDDVTKSKYLRKLIIADLAKRKSVSQLTTRASRTAKEPIERSERSLGA